MSEAERSLPTERRPACDNCKTRKTKCDRRSPCASCVTLEVACRTTHRVAEKRQRVILSTKYEDAVQDVSRQLAEVREMLQTIMMSNKDTAPLTSNSREVSLDSAGYTPQSMIDEQVPVLDSVQEGYHGDTSFTSHAHQIKTTLEATLLPSELEFPPSTSVESNNNQGDTAGAVMNPVIKSNDVGLGNTPLPPNEIVLKLLRLIKTEEQRFFIDLPLFNRDEFIDMCRDIYFATEPISLWTWICVNVGLHTLFAGLTEASCKRLGTTVDAMYAHMKIPRANAEAALRSLRLCSEPSTESCRALAVLANFYVRQGHSTIAWRLISGAARAALDLGLHRLPTNPDANDVPKEVGLFWHIYTWEKGLAMTCGKSPTIRHSDVTSGLHLLATPENRPGRLNTLYGAFVDMAVVMGEIQECLFSVVAQQSSQQIRLQHVKRLASCLLDINTAVKSICPDDPSWEGLISSTLGGISTTLHIVLHCQLAIVYRFLPPELMNSQILSLVPLVPFIVLAGNAIATSSGSDLPLLSKLVKLLVPAAANSPLIREVHGACESLSRIAERVVASASPLNLNGQQEYVHGQDQFDYAFPMGQQDWDSVMVGFESEFGNYDSRTLTNIIEPCFANTYW
ncbi:hypothetical protein ONZ43_g6241 [Nemania bipapillata]|uniref:Uncharacterized protein n=1 Tax=Nemania bipapillata TaxID=110536 RepID=A0ACC2I1E5_9PEZI|nr:hypothetical protein ONZ43_g6241 [Nemania bipapillata]